MNKKKKAFTLVELLIAMFIFAMLAVLLIPNVSNNAEKELFATQLKKVQNDIQQAMLLMMSQNQGSLRAFCSGAGNGGECFTKAIAQRLDVKIAYGRGYSKVVDNQEQDNLDDVNNVTTPEGCAIGEENPAKNACYQAVSYAARKPQTISKQAFTSVSHPASIGNGSFYAINLGNGAAVSTIFDYRCNGVAEANINSPNNNNYRICGYMEVDLNAGKAPNMIGKDIHYFWIVDKDGIVPFGEIDAYTCQNVKTSNNDDDVLGCTARILREGKITYY